MGQNSELQVLQGLKTASPVLFIKQQTGFID
jgi:hypothetical protein